MRMDRLIPAAHHPQGQQCQTSPICPTISKQTKTCRHNSIFHWKSNHWKHRDRQNPEHSPRISKTCKDILGARIATPSQTHHMGPCHRITPWSAGHTPRTAPPTNPSRNRGSTKIRRRTPQTKYNPAVLEPLCSKFLLRKEERWQITPRSRLQTLKQVDKKKQKRVATNPISRGSTGGMYALHQI